MNMVWFRFRKVTCFVNIQESSVFNCNVYIKEGISILCTLPLQGQKCE